MTLEISYANMQFIAVLIVPGFVALKVYDLFVPSERRDFSKSMVDVVVYSMLNLALWWWVVALINANEFPTNHPVFYIIITYIIVLLSPAAIAYAFFELRRRKIFRDMLHPMPTAWDYFFAKQTGAWILFHLKNGGKIGGFYGQESFASAHPNPPQVYVEKVWRVDGKGAFQEQVDRSAGMIIQYSDCDLIELFGE